MHMQLQWRSFFRLQFPEKKITMSGLIFTHLVLVTDDVLLPVDLDHWKIYCYFQQPLIPLQTGLQSQRFSSPFASLVPYSQPVAFRCLVLPLVSVVALRESVGMSDWKPSDLIQLDPGDNVS